MRSRAAFLGLAPLVGCLLATVYGGCFDPLGDCAQTLTCPPPSGTSTSSSGGDAGPPPECIPSQSGTPVDDACGVFVSSSIGDDGNAGTSKSAPVKSLKRALMVGAQTNLPVYACAEEFANASGETLSMSAGRVLFGGLDCAGDWSYVGDAKKSVVQGASDATAMVLRAGGGVTRLEDFVVRAADASLAGGSSIAVLAEPSTILLSRCDLIAGNGMNGDKGVTPTDDIGPGDPNDVAIRGANGKNAAAGDVVAGNAGGAGAVNALCMSAVGGNGGTGFADHGGDGTDGMPAGAFGAHGVGEPAMGSWNCILGGGQLGDNGTPGTEGASATDMDLGVLALTGFTSAAGKEGTEGSPGQGGGGAGAAKGKVGTNGASGGGGGAGGCGGKGGRGGQGGGASVGLASLGATLTFNAVSITAGSGGSGGDGGLGQAGATGGSGGTGGIGDPINPKTLAACDGGKGGTGGSGGDGGAGRGGHSLGIAYTGSAPSLEGVSFSLGSPGQGGKAFLSTGAPGIAANTLAFP